VREVSLGMRPTNQNGHFQSIGSARWFLLPGLSISRSSVRLKAAGVEFVEAPTDYRAGDPLQPTSTATTVRMKQGKTLMTDGPFAETKEQLAGYNIVEAQNLDEAISIVARNPLLRAGHSFEVRPIRELPPR